MSEQESAVPAPEKALPSEVVPPAPEPSNDRLGPEEPTPASPQKAPEAPPEPPSAEPEASAPVSSPSPPAPEPEGPSLKREEIELAATIPSSSNAVRQAKSAERVGSGPVAAEAIPEEIEPETTVKVLNLPDLKEPDTLARVCRERAGTMISQGLLWCQRCGAVPLRGDMGHFVCETCIPHGQG